MLRVNQVLYTRDGRIIGNAIIIEKFTNNGWTIKTDYGNEVILGEKEIKKLFFVEDEKPNNTHKYAVKTGNNIS